MLPCWTPSVAARPAERSALERPDLTARAATALPFRPQGRERPEALLDERPQLAGPFSWSGRRESNPHHQLGRLELYH